MALGGLFIPVSLQRFMTAGRGKDFCPRRRLVPPWWTSGQWDNTRCGLTFSTTTTSEITSETIALQRKKERNNEITKKMSKTFVASTNLSEFYFSFSFFLSISFFAAWERSVQWRQQLLGREPIQSTAAVVSWRMRCRPLLRPFSVSFYLCALFSLLTRSRKKERKKEKNLLIRVVCCRRNTLIDRLLHTTRSTKPSECKVLICFANEMDDAADAERR